MEKTTVSSLVDQAVDDLPRLRKRVLKGYFRMRPAARKLVEDQVMLSMSEHEECCAMSVVVLSSMDGEIPSGADSVQTLAQAMDSDVFGADTPFAIDLEKLERLLQIIVEYLPKILQIILPLFV